MKTISERTIEILFELKAKRPDLREAAIADAATLGALDEWQKSVEERLSGREVFPPMLGGWK